MAVPPDARPVARVLACAVLLVAGAASAAPASAVRPDLAKPISGTHCSEFPADNYWHADVSQLPVHARSAAWLSHMSSDVDLHPDFGPSYGDGPNYGIPITVVSKKHAKSKVRFDYASESDRVKYPVGRDTKIEGGRNSDGDRHAIIVDKDKCKLYELYATSFSNGRWHAGSGAVWSLKNNKLRPDGWTSADAAGLPILPGLLRWNEVKKNRIDHAIRFTTRPPRPISGPRGTTPAPTRRSTTRRWAPGSGFLDLRRVRPLAVRTVRRGRDEEVRPRPRRQRLGVVLQGEQNAARRPAGRGPQDDPASAFVAVDTASLMVSPSSAQVH